MNQTPLYLAAVKNHIEIVKYLVEHDADKEAKDTWNQTSLHQAASEGLVSLYLILILKRIIILMILAYKLWNKNRPNK
jgi:ankyrin repeat protein